MFKIYTSGGFFFKTNKKIFDLRIFDFVKWDGWELFIL